MSAVDQPQLQQQSRYSTYSGAPSIQPSIAPTMESRNNSAQEKKAPAVERPPSIASSAATDPRSADIKQYAAGYERMADQRLEGQKFVPSGEKSDELYTNALGAKLERALERRMSEQDALAKAAELNEKAEINEKPVEVAA